MSVHVTKFLLQWQLDCWQLDGCVREGVFGKMQGPFSWVLMHTCECQEAQESRHEQTHPGTGRHLWTTAAGQGTGVQQLVGAC